MPSQDKITENRLREAQEHYTQMTLKDLNDFNKRLVLIDALNNPAQADPGELIGKFMEMPSLIERISDPTQRLNAKNLLWNFYASAADKQNDNPLILKVLENLNATSSQINLFKMLRDNEIARINKEQAANAQDNKMNSDKQNENINNENKNKENKNTKNKNNEDDIIQNLKIFNEELKAVKNSTASLTTQQKEDKANEIAEKIKTLDARINLLDKSSETFKIATNMLWNSYDSEFNKIESKQKNTLLMEVLTEISPNLAFHFKHERDEQLYNLRNYAPIVGNNPKENENKNVKKTVSQGMKKAADFTLKAAKKASYLTLPGALGYGASSAKDFYQKQKEKQKNKETRNEKDDDNERPKLK